MFPVVDTRIPFPKCFPKPPRIYGHDIKFAKSQSLMLYLPWDLILPSVQIFLHIISWLGGGGSLGKLVGSAYVGGRTLTVLAWLVTMKVCAWVVVLRIVGIGRKSFAMVNADVGKRGFVFVATIFVGGTGCIGAYLQIPVCDIKGTANISGLTGMSPAGAAAPAAIALTDGGAAVVAIGARTGANTPVIAARLNRGE